MSITVTSGANGSWTGREVAVQTAATVLIAANAGQAGFAAPVTDAANAALRYQKTVNIQNNGPNPIFIGPSSTITGASTAALQIPAGQSASLDFGPNLSIYACCPGGAQVSGAATNVLQAE